MTTFFQFVFLGILFVLLGGLVFNALAKERFEEVTTFGAIQKTRFFSFLLGGLLATGVAEIFTIHIGLLVFVLVLTLPFVMVLLLIFSLFLRRQIRVEFIKYLALGFAVHILVFTFVGALYLIVL